MKLLPKRDRPPSELIAVLKLDERVVSWGDTSDGSVVAATPRGLWWPATDGFRLIGWQRISKASWRDGRVSVIEAEVLDDLLLLDKSPVIAQIATPRDLPETIRKRVEANVVRSELVAVSGGTARIVARRVPGEDGLKWWVRLEGSAVDSDQLRSALRARIARLSSDFSEQGL